MAIAEDASTPGLKTHATNTALTSNSFTPPAGTLVIVMASWGFTTNFAGSSIACTSSDGGSWTTAVSRIDNSGGSSVYVFYRYYASSPGAITVTTTVTAGGGGANFQDVRVLTGADSNQASGATASAQPSNTVYNTSINTTTVDSVVYGMGDVQSSTSVLSAVSNFSTINLFDSASCYQVSGKRIATVTPGATNVGWTSSTSSPGVIAFFEVLPTSGPVTKNGSDTGNFPAAGETASVTVKPALETGTLTDSATVVVQVTDTGHLNESASAGEFKPVTETGTLTDTASVIVGTNKVVSDSGTLSDTAFTTMGAVASDGGTLSDTARIIVQVSETASVHDSAQILEDGYLVAERVKVIPADNRVRRIEAEDRNVFVDPWDDE